MKKGDYVRTIDGIWKIEAIKTNHLQVKSNGNYICYFKKEIIKSSPNIIDLIKVGDYVNGERVNYIDDCKGAMREFYYTFEEATHDVGHYEEEIISIVTKEQFESMEYRV